MTREMLCFTIETAAGGCEGRWCRRRVRAMVGYARLCSDMVGYARGSPHCNDGSEVGRCDCRLLDAV